MLELKNINIKFDRELINNGSLTILDGKITAIIGESGCGKSTLLYHLGLITSNNQYQYLYNNNEINLSNDTELSGIRKTKIGYIFQDNNLIEDLTVKENIRLSATIAGIQITDESIRDYLDTVELSALNENQYPRQLSGGERQRAALASVLAKQPDLIIADEPTSSLDQTNTEIIMGIFKKIAYEFKKKVVIASHNEKVYTLADVIYELRDKRIDVKKGQALLTETIDEQKLYTHSNYKLKPGFYYNYAKKIARKSRKQKLLMTILCAVAIAFSAVVYNFGDAFFEQQEQLMDELSNREIFVVNMTTPGQALHHIDNDPITAPEAAALAQISNVDTIYPFLEFRSDGIEGTGSNMRPISKSNIKVLINQTEQNYEFDGSDPPPYNMFSLISYYPEQGLEKRVNIESPEGAEDGVYLSAHLAHALDIDDLEEPVLIQLQACVPVGVEETEMTVGGGTAGGGTYDILIDVSAMVELEFRVAGILNANVVNRYSGRGPNVIYVPYSSMQEILEETQAQYAEEDQEWSSSSYVLFAKHYNQVETIMERVSFVNPNFASVSEYQDIETMNAMITNVREIAFSIVLAVLVIIFLLMSIIHMNYVLGRKYEIAQLKANGLTRLDLLKLIMVESARHIVIVTVLASVVSISLVAAVNLLFSYTMVSVGAGIFAINLLVSLLSVFVPTIISVVVINKYKPDSIMRN
ncbi:MAG: ATP-binding cassette domain-containing protein [Firmicutes bacterium]|nr:ATP-binding cassette domain-containing protein [Bacillota bacterium]